MGKRDRGWGYERNMLRRSGSTHRRIDASAVGNNGQTGDGVTRVERRNGETRSARLLVVAALSSS